MLFVEPFFLLIFLPLAVTAMYVAGRFVGPTAALAVIVISSALFYSPYGALAGALLCGSLCLNLLVGSRLSLSDDSKRWRKGLLVIGFAYNFALLATFKYVDAIAAMFSPSAAPIIGIAIPAGISFYTFHQAVFLLNAYHHTNDVQRILCNVPTRFKALRNLIRYSAFVGFFPQLVIGPITYMSEFAPQVLRNGFGHFRIRDLQVGTTLILIGLFKKLCIADTLAEIVNPVFAATSAGLAISTAQSMFAIMGYFFQLYFDFSGYADMALGVARLFGIRLPINFDSPLRATGIVDFYRRWHITLTRVIALFLFTPLSLWGTRFAIDRDYTGWRRRFFVSWLPFLANFQVIALWHGAALTFTVFGLIHGTWYIIESEVRRSRIFKSYRAFTSDRMRMLLGVAITAVPLMLTFALFRSSSLTAFWNLIAGLPNWNIAGPTTAPITKNNWLILGLFAFLVYTAPNAYDLMRRYRPGIITYANPSMVMPLLRWTWRPNLLWALFVAGLAVGAFIRLNKPTQFLYGGF